MRAAAVIKNAHGQTVDRLGGAIVAGRYAVRRHIPPEPLLCEELGVSRTVVREAVKSLVAKGLVGGRSQGGHARAGRRTSGTGSTPTSSRGSPTPG